MIMLADTKIPEPEKTDKQVLEWNRTQLVGKNNSVPGTGILLLGKL
jgi:hypothetical protein